MNVSDLIILSLFGFIVLSVDFILYRIIKKIDKSVKFWMVLIPFYNLFLFVRSSGTNPWLFFLLFIPILNILYLMFIWYKILKKLNMDEFDALYWSTAIMLLFGLPTIWIGLRKEKKVSN